MPEPDKTLLYREAESRMAGLLGDLEDPIAAMATCCSLLHETLPDASWTGFYRVVAPRLLRIGPYQGPLGCIEIPFDRGVCGEAARRRQTVLVDDVRAFAGHIACDPLARSEIVVPIFDSADNLVAVLDLDSHRPGAFDRRDREGLERIAALLKPCFPA